MKGQKEAVVEMVMRELPSFKRHEDIALILMSKDQLEQIKTDIGNGILNGTIEYSKSRSSVSEVTAYARSMVMNHLKKAKELNGGQVYGKTPAVVQATKEEKKLSAFNVNSLPDDLQSYVRTLV